MKLKLIVLIITLLSISCSNTSYNISNISYEDNIKIKDSIIDLEIELIIKPFRNKINTQNFFASGGIFLCIFPNTWDS